MTVMMNTSSVKADLTPAERLDLAKRMTKQADDHLLSIGQMSTTTAFGATGQVTIAQANAYYAGAAAHLAIIKTEAALGVES